MPGLVPELYLRMGSHAEKQYVLKTVKLFTGVIVGANLVESTPGATVSFAVKILGGSKKAFAIDPMTYTFGMNIQYIQSETIDRTARKAGARKTALKRSFARLAESYGSPVDSALLSENRPVVPSDFTEPGIRSFAIGVYHYQADRMRSQWESDPQLRELAEKMPHPSFAFAPYFFVPFRMRGGRWREWHELNMALAAEFAEIDGPLPKHAVLCIERSMLESPRDAEEICKAYIGTGCSACWLWPSMLTEPDIAPNELDVLVHIAQMFRDAGIKLYNLHGGYLSGLLSKHGMIGFSHGIGYGEAKDVVPVIGATVPTVNYHLPPIHTRIPMLELERALPKLGVKDATDFQREICDCTVCKGVLGGDVGNLREFGDMVVKVGNTRESQTPDSAKKCRFHFLLARKKEIDRIAASSLDQLKQQLSDSYNTYQALPPYLALRDKSGHLRVWRDGI